MATPAASTPLAGDASAAIASQRMSHRLSAGTSIRPLVSSMLSGNSLSSPCSLWPSTSPATTFVVITTPTVFAMIPSAAAPSPFEAGQPVVAIERGGLVALGQGWIVEDRIDEVVERAVQRHHCLTDVHEFRRALTDDVHAQHLFRFAMEDQLQPSGRVTANLPAGDFAIIRYAHLVRHVLFGELLFGFADEGDFGDGVDAVWIEARVRLHRFVAEGALRGDAALFHGDRRERRESDDVADGEDVRNLGAEILVDRDTPALVGLDAGRGEVELVDVALAAHRVKQNVAGDALLTLEIRDHGAVGQFFHALDLFAQAHGHAAVAEVVAESFDDFLIGKFKQARPLLHQRHAHAQRRKHASVFHANDAAAHDDEALGQILQIEHLVAVDDGAPVHRNRGRNGRARAHGDHDMVGLVGIHPTHSVHVNVVIVFEARDAVDHFHAVARELRLGYVDLRLNDMLHAEGKIGHGDLFLHAVVHAVDGAVVVAGEVQHGFAHGLAGDGAGVDAHAPHHAAHLNQRHVLTLLDRGNSGALTRRARTDNEKIVFRHACKSGRAKSADRKEPRAHLNLERPWRGETVCEFTLTLF